MAIIEMEGRMTARSYTTSTADSGDGDVMDCDITVDIEVVDADGETLAQHTAVELGGLRIHDNKAWLENVRRLEFIFDRDCTPKELLLRWQGEDWGAMQLEPRAYLKGHSLLIRPGALEVIAADENINKEDYMSWQRIEDWHTLRMLGF